MHTPADERTPLTLVIQRLMDADLLLPDEGSALLAEVAACDPVREAGRERASERSEPLLRMLEALLQAERQDASVAGQAKVIVRRILYGENEPD